MLLAVVLLLASAGCGGSTNATTAIDAKLAAVPARSLVASSRWGVYHSPRCPLARLIPVEDLAVFPSAAAAEDAMCRPCKQCGGK